MGTKFSKSEIGEVIRRVITYYLRKRELGLERRKELFLVPRFPVGFQELLAEFELYGELESVDFLLAEEGLEALNITGCRLFYIYDKRDVSYILNGLTAYEKLEIYAPSLDMLRALKEGKEADLFTRISIYFLMSGKPVMVRLPYDINGSFGGAFGRITRELKEARFWRISSGRRRRNAYPRDGRRGGAGLPERGTFDSGREGGCNHASCRR